MSRVKLEVLLERSKKNIGDVNNVVKESIIEVIKRAYKEGINVQISEGFRSNTRQTKLYNQGRVTGGKIVTNAKAGESYHNYGLAVDYFLTTENGKSAVWEVNKNWRRVAEIAKSLGFEWGGDWNKFKDYPHLQMSGGLSITQLKNGKRPTLKSKINGSVESGKVTSNDLPNVILYYKKTVKYSEDVKKYQQALANLYFYPEKGAKNNGVDGYFGKKTEDCVIRFQSVYLPHEVDGVIGKNTRAKIIELSK